MKNKKLFTLAEILAVKIAEINPEDIRTDIEKHIKQAIYNASQNKSSGIMDFHKMQIEDDVELSVSIVRDTTLGMNTVKVINVEVSDPSLQTKYFPLKSQIQKYLEKNIALFQTFVNQQRVDYDYFAIVIDYKPDDVL